MLEQILSDIQKADPEWNVILLRYFNPIGAHKSGTMGENPNGIPNNLMPYITQVAVGKLPELGVFGNDYDTHDGTFRRPRGWRFLIPSSPDGTAISPPAMRTQALRRRSLAGRPSTESGRCARTPGDGRKTIPTDMRTELGA